MKHLTSLALAGLLVVSASCAKDSNEELTTWMQESCSCRDLRCAETQRAAFWELVQEFRDEDPSKDEADKLNSLVSQGQACLTSLSVDIYALR